MLKTPLWAAVNSSMGGNGALPSCRAGSSAPEAIFSGFGEGTKIANNPPANPPCRAIGRSNCPLSSPSRNARGASAPPRR
jgi:hypothetical protein